MKLQTKILGRKVHEVGYRAFLLHKAMELGCHQFSAYNRFEEGLQTVVALIEGDEGQLLGFKGFVEESKPETSEVSGTFFEEYHGHVMSVENFMHFSVVEQLNKGIPALLRLDQKQDKMLEKQDGTIAKLEETRSDVVHEIRASSDEVVSKLDENREAIVAEIGDQKITLDNRLKRIEDDISKLKAKVGI
jgi:acylphosphatase